MEPTIRAGSEVVVDVAAYQHSEPSRWDVIAFEPPASAMPGGGGGSEIGQVWLMRVVGLPGEVVEFGGEEILVNGEVLGLPEELAGIEYAGLEGLAGAGGAKVGQVTLAQDAYFVLGDNAARAFDSRFWGGVERRRIKGKLAGP